MSDTNYSIERIADRMEIQDRLHMFSRGVDRRDWPLALSVYHDGAIDHHGIYEGPARGFIEFVKKRHETVLLSMHHLSNIIIEFAGKDSAVVESYCFAWQSLSPDNTDMRAVVDRQNGLNDRPLELLMVSRYVDHFTRRSQVWRIQERTVVFESSMKVTAEATGPDVRGAMEQGRRDENDCLWLLRAKLLTSAQQ